MSKSNRDLQKTVSDTLSSNGLDVVDFVSIPQSVDRMVRLRSLEETLDDFDNRDQDNVRGYLIQVRVPGSGASHDEISRSIEVEDHQEEPVLDSPVKSSGVEEIYQKSGDLNIRFLFENAAILTESKDFPLARNVYKAILTSGKDSAKAHRGLAFCFESESKPIDAIAHYEASLTYESNLDIYQRLAALLIKEKRDVDAAQVIDRALNLKGLDSEVQYELLKAGGNCRVRSERFARAIDLYRRALEIRPDSDEMMTNLGAVYLQNQEFMEAKDFFEQAVSINPRNAKALSGLGSCAIATRDYHSAHDFFAESLEIDIKNPTAIYHLVQCAYGLKSYVSAERLLGEYIHVSPINVHLLYSLAGLQYHLRYFDQARRTVGEILKIDSDHRGAKDLLKLME